MVRLKNTRNILEIYWGSLRAPLPRCVPVLHWTLHVNRISLSHLGPPKFCFFPGVNQFSMSKSVLGENTRCSTETCFAYLFFTHRVGWHVAWGLLGAGARRGPPQRPGRWRGSLPPPEWAGRATHAGSGSAHTRGGEAGREAAADLPVPHTHPVNAARRAQRGRRHLRAGPGGALAAARGVSCRVVSCGAEPRRAARPRGDSPAGTRAPLPPPPPPPLDRSHFSCTKLRGGRGGAAGPAVRRYVLPGEGRAGGRAGPGRGGGRRLSRAAGLDVRLEQLSSAGWGGLGWGGNLW